MKVVVAASGVPFRRGPAEMLAGRLCRALSAAGHAVESIVIPFSDYPPACIAENMLACRLLDLTETCGTRIDRLIALNFPAYLVPHPHKVIWLAHQHRAAYELWDEPAEGNLADHPEGPDVRAAIHKADRELLPGAKAVFTVDLDSSDRLQKFSGITAEPLYHPPENAPLFRKGTAGDYFFCPSRNVEVDRLLMIIQAMVGGREKTKARFAGGEPSDSGACADAIRQSGLQDRVECLGAVTEEQQRDLFANCLAVIHPPRNAEYPYSALEAMLSAKPVITCADSAGHRSLVADRQTGLVAGATPESMTLAMDSLWANRASAAAMGDAGRARYEQMKISWEHVVEKLLC